jgi:hypothetical protein
MQNDSTDPRIPDASERIINYRPERAEFEFQRPDAPVTVSILPVPQDIVAFQPAAATPAARVTVKKPFTLGHALIIFVEIIIVLVAGYFAYVTWLA